MNNRLITIFLLLITAISSQANPIFNWIQKAGTIKEYPNSNVLVLYDSTSVKMEESGLSHFYTHQMYKVLSIKGARELNTIKFDYDPLTAYTKINEVIIYRAKGTIDTISKKNIYDYPAPARAIYWGARQKMIDIGYLEVGDAIKIQTYKKGFTYALLQNRDDDEKYIPPMRGHFYDIVPFWSNRPVKIKYYSVYIPKTKVLRYKFYNGEVEEKKRLFNKSTQYMFSAKEILPMKGERNMVAWSDVAPKLLLSTSPDWQAKSRWFYKVNEDYGSFVPTKEVEKKVNELLKDAKNEMDSVSILTHWVADNMRYSGISMGKGEGFTLHNAEMNFTDRCGVCKDKASLLISMLRAAGFEAYAAMTMAGSRIDKIPADQFNHSVTAVKLSDGKFHMLDPTWVPFVRELWSSAEQQQNYLIGTEKGEDLMETPISPAENHYIKMNGYSKLSENGTLTGSFTIETEGQSDAVLRRQFTGRYKTEWNKVLLKGLTSASSLFRIDSADYGKPWDYSEPMKIFVKYSIPEYALVTEDEIIFKPLLATQIFDYLSMHLFIDTSIVNRKYNFRDRCSRYVVINEKIKLPEYKSIKELPETISKEGTGASYESEYKLEKDVLLFSQKAKYKKRIYRPEDWSSYKYAVKMQHKTAEEKIIMLK